ncbi:MAG: DUF3553 domain-containing protein [Pelagibacteraceae bacterium]|nr:DUF3553 domain-containing protein [Pelagibacteraceae bacterium]PPR10073.1 MAG: hypothetical protein CFH41_02128 [Alphaproteobacteria bacterium MarineAlpha11_Bin1]|tara:strand:- start:1501 stop:1686 length:186 start_codon:yes stop_codon:yes gene_type:complete
MNHDIVPGTYVLHPTEHEWGLGQVQSVDGSRITVNFENVGKYLINADVIDLKAVNETEIDD